MSVLGLAAVMITPIAGPGPEPASPSAAPTLAFIGDPGEAEFGTVVVEGLPRTVLRRLSGGVHVPWEDLFPVLVGDISESPAQPAILGRHEILGDRIRFTPRFTFLEGMTYSALFEGAVLDRLTSMPDGTTPRLQLTFTMPQPPGAERTRVTAVFPSTESVPSNLLRLYIHFSAPMLAKDVHRHVHLEDSLGNRLPLPFVEVREGLWDSEQRRLTLFLHPGRVKRGVAPGENLGPVLTEGGTFRFVVDGSMRDATGEPLGDRYEKVLRVTRADRKSPDPGEWSVRVPSTHDGPLSLGFPEPLDSALLRRLIRVESQSGEPVTGRISIAEKEMRWEFLPDRGWTHEEYRIVINPALEDLAGNTLNRLFEEQGAPGHLDDRTEQVIQFTIP